MGIPAAFLLGAVNGFTKNIEEEKLRRQTERDKLDQYQAMMFDAMIKGDLKSQSAADVITKAISDARTKINEKPSIDIFGRKSDPVDFEADMFNTLGLLSDVDDSNTFFVGKVGVPVGERYESTEGTDAGAEMELNHFGQYYYKNIDDFKKNFVPGTEEFDVARQWYIGRASRYLMSMQKFGNDNKPINTVDVSMIPYFDDMNKYFGITDDIQFEIEKEIILNQSGPDSAGGAAALMESPMYVSPQTFPNKFEINNPLVPVDFMKLFPKDVEWDYTEDQIRSSIDSIANSQGVTTERWVYNFSKYFEDIPNGYERMQESMVHSVNLYQMNALKPTSQDQINIGKYLMSQEGLRGDPLSQINAMVSLSFIQQDVTDSFFETAGIQTTSKNFDTKFKDAAGFSVKEVAERSAAASRTLTLTEQYKTHLLRSDLASGSVAQRTVSWLSSTFGETGQLSQVASILGINEGTDEYKYLEAEWKVRDIDNLAEEAAAMQTLAIIIATEGAKAKDQQGRLSEGDIQRELVAFKSESGSVEAQLASLETYEATVELIRDELAVYDGIIAEGVIGREQLELLRAAKKVNNAKTAFRSTYGLGTTGGTIQTGDEFPETLGFLDDGDTTQFYDLDSFNANKPSSVPSIVRIGTDSMANTLYELEDGRVVNAFEFQKRYQISPDFVGSAGSQPPTGGATTTPPGGTGGATTPPPPPAGTGGATTPPAGTGGATTPPPSVPQPPATQPPIINAVGGSMTMRAFYSMLKSMGISPSHSVTQAGTLTFPGLDGEYSISGQGNTIVRVK
tara:strand:- start:4934 stop:7312 length:2379 start_codon:yes stop_codon:yes gene_type:complete